MSVWNVQTTNLFCGRHKDPTDDGLSCKHPENKSGICNEQSCPTKVKVEAISIPMKCPDCNFIWEVYSNYEDNKNCGKCGTEGIRVLKPKGDILIGYPNCDKIQDKSPEEIQNICSACDYNHTC